MDMTLGFLSRPLTFALFDDYRAPWRQFVARRQRRRDLRRVARLGPRLLADAGFEETEVQAAVAGSWDDPELRLMLTRSFPLPRRDS